MFDLFDPPELPAELYYIRNECDFHTLDITNNTDCLLLASFLVLMVDCVVVLDTYVRLLIWRGAWGFEEGACGGGRWGRGLIGLMGVDEGWGLWCVVCMWGWSRGGFLKGWRREGGVW